MEKRRKTRKEHIKNQQNLRKKEIKIHQERRKLSLIKRQEAHEIRAKEMAIRRTEVKNILKNREKTNIKRIIKIKAPKSAKFNMNVRYGAMSFPK